MNDMEQKKTNIRWHILSLLFTAEQEYITSDLEEATTEKASYLKLLKYRAMWDTLNNN